MKLKLPIIVVGTMLLLTGCSGLNTESYLKNTHSFLISQGKPPAYVDGYVDGCASGRLMAGDTSFKYRKDIARADRDALYARGWQDGQIACRNEVLVEQQQGANGAMPCATTDDARRRQEEAEMREIWDELKK